MLDVAALSDRLGCVVRCPKPATPRAIPVREVMELLEAHGIVYFDGFGADIHAFEAFAKRFEAGRPLDLPEDVEKEYVTNEMKGVVQAHVQRTGRAPPLITREVSPGQGALHVHAENSFLPFPPDLIWFYCARPAKRGGRTTVCDGVRLLAEMDSATRDFFFAQNISYRQTWTRATWSSLFQTDDVAMARQVVSMIPGVSADIEGHDLLRVKHSVSAIKKTRFGGRSGFVNAILYTYDLPDIYGLCMDDGTPIPASIVASLRSLIERIQVFLPWKAEDCALLDNSRVMHGREAFVGDAERYVRVLEIQNAVA